MKRVALFTTFYEVASGYSLVAVAETQLRMLLDGGYEPVALVQENFTADSDSLWRPEVIDLRAVIPFMHLSGGKIPEDFDERVEKIYAALKDNLTDIDVCITHDIILQSFYREHNMAMRKYAKERPDLLWLHWIHSCPSEGTDEYPNGCRHTSPPGYIAYPNSSDAPMVCRGYRLMGKEWKVVTTRSGHSIDPMAVSEYHKLTRDLVSKSDLMDGDVSVVYPARLDVGKQPEKIIRLMAGVKKMGYEPRLLIIDWQSMGERFQTYINKLIKLAESLGVGAEVNFTSRLNDECNNGVPRRVVLELMDLSNVYIHPSRVETYSLVAHEAILKGNLIVLNFDLPVMREIYGDSAIYMDFGSDRVDRTYAPDEQAFWNDEAGRIIAELKHNRTLWAQTRARREWSPKAQWREFEPLLHLTPVGE